LTEEDAVEFFSYKPPLKKLLVPNFELLISPIFWGSLLQNVPHIEEINMMMTYSHFQEGELDGKFFKFFFLSLFSYF
jgi:hypothetical protein